VCRSTLSKPAVRQAALGLGVGVFLGGALVVAATSFAQTSDSHAPTIDHQGEANHTDGLPPGILVEAANLTAKIEHLVDPNAPCLDGPCLGGDILAVASAALDRCAKIGGEEYSAQNPGLDPKDPLISLDRVISATCEDLRIALKSNDSKADRAVAVARVRAPEMRAALVVADESVRTP